MGFKISNGKGDDIILFISISILYLFVFGIISAALCKIPAVKKAIEKLLNI